MNYKIRELIELLNDATKAYDNSMPYMSDREWDDKYFELQNLEKETGIIYPDSPTHHISYQVVSNLNKVKHSHPMMSLAKTKSIEDAEGFIRKCTSAIVMAKMDGLTCSLRYEDGKLVGAETRGNGEIGEDILHTALTVHNIPKEIKYKGTLVVDGEVICTLSNFENFKEDYKNPRNFAAGSIRLLDSAECAKRKLSFIAWDCIEGLDNLLFNNLSAKLCVLMDFGFETVPWCGPSSDDSFQSCIDFLTKECSNYPIDGLVIKEDDCARYASAGLTSHHPQAALAFKFHDEEYETTLIDIEWGTGRGDILTPVAIFEPVDDGESTITRASLHNWSVLHEILGHPYRGQRITIAKMNQIIPQVVSAEINKIVDHYDEFDYITTPSECPVCGGTTKLVESDGGIMNLICENPSCEGKVINRLVHYCSRKGLDIKGLSEATLEKLLEWGWITNIVDIYSLHEHRAEWEKKPGFGKKSVDNILTAIENSKSCELHSFITALGIPLIGSTYAKEMAKHEADYVCFREDVAKHFDYTEWNGFGYEMRESLWNFNYTEADKLGLDILNISNSLYKDPFDTKSTNNLLANANMVITGKLTLYKNRNELQAAIEAAGGKVVSSISKNTTMLINNDINSTSSKNAAAKKLGIPIISEKDFQEKYLKDI